MDAYAQDHDHASTTGVLHYWISIPSNSFYPMAISSWTIAAEAMAEKLYLVAWLQRAAAGCRELLIRVSSLLSS
jgi:hypothetical protein